MMETREGWISISAKNQNFICKLSNILAVHDPGSHTLIVYMAGNHVVYLEFLSKEDRVNIYNRLCDLLLEG